ncbi:MAG: nonstructural protein [Microviridae sp.]|nr:MAG: nonstructural protein [Microviridae sp.]
MRYKMVVVRDRAADVYNQPAFVPSLGIAIRSFADEVNRVDVNNQLNKHPEDFDLFYLGEYDDNSGEFDAVRPQQIAVGKDVVIKS